MFLKILGGIVVIVSAYALGIYYSFRESYRIEDLSEFKKAFTMLISEIEFNLTPIGDAMKNISERLGEPVKKIMSDFSEKVKNPDSVELYQIWANILEENKKNTYLTEEDISSFNSFGKILGYLDKRLQINNIKIIIQYIDEKTLQINEKNNQNKKMYKSFGFLGGLLIVVILI